MTTILYNSITLQPGEQFILPPNAELVGAESIADIDSTCTLPELDDVDCYTAIIAFAGNDGSVSQAWEIQGLFGLVVSGSVELVGFATKAGATAPTVTTFTSPYTFNVPFGIDGGLDPLKTELLAKLSGVFNLQVAQSSSEMNRRYKLYVNFKTTALIAESLFMVVKTTTQGEVINYVPFQLHSTIVSGGGQENLPTCS